MDHKLSYDKNLSLYCWNYYAQCSLTKQTVTIQSLVLIWHHKQRFHIKNFQSSSAGKVFIRNSAGKVFIRNSFNRITYALFRVDDGTLLQHWYSPWWPHAEADFKK